MTKNNTNPNPTTTSTLNPTIVNSNRQQQATIAQDRVRMPLPLIHPHRSPHDLRPPDFSNPHSMHIAHPPQMALTPSRLAQLSAESAPSRPASRLAPQAPP